MVNVIRERICRQYFLGIKDCFESNYNKEYTITYKNKNEELRSAFITFKHEPTYEKFNRDDISYILLPGTILSLYNIVDIEKIHILQVSIYSIQRFLVLFLITLLNCC